MEETKRFAFIWIVCCILAVATIVSFVVYTRQLAIRLTQPEPWKLAKHWWRFVLPSVITIILASISADITMSVFGHAAWIIGCGVFIPFWLTWNSFRSVLAKKWERVMAVITLILLLNACFLTAGWSFARRAQSNSYIGKARVVDWFSSGQYTQDTMKVELEWACWSDDDTTNYYCRDNQVIDCGEVTKKELFTIYDYDMSIYNQNTFIDCQDGFNMDTWKQYGWANNKWADDDRAEEEDENQENDENDDGNRPYMKIVADCNTCEIDSHGNGNMYKAKRNWLVIPMWILTSLAALVSAYFWTTRTEEKSSSQKLVHQPEFA